MKNSSENHEHPDKPASVNPLLQISSNRMDEIVKSYQAAKQVAFHAVTNNVGDRNDSASLFPGKNASRARNKAPKYDPQNLVMRGMISSEDVTRRRLSSRDENTQNSLGKSAIDEEEDATFFENLKKRITEDIQRKLRKGPEDPAPRRSTTVRKRKSAFDDETLNLMSKYRNKFWKRRDAPSTAADNGVFSLATKLNNENEENIAVSRMTMENDAFVAAEETPSRFFMGQLETPAIDFPDDEVDYDDFRCPTPSCVNFADERPTD